MDGDGLMRIGEVAGLTHLSLRTKRHYAQGLATELLERISTATGLLMESQVPNEPARRGRA